MLAMQLLHEAVGEELIVDPELRAHLEAKVVQSMSLKDIEAMVENDERVRNAAADKKSRLIIIPKGKNGEGEEEREAFIIQRKPKKPSKENVESREFREDYDGGLRRFSYEPASFGFESEFRRRDDFPNLFRISDLESAASGPAEKFYESIVGRIMDNREFELTRNPLELLEIASSDEAPQYKPRFDYDAYSKDSTETKLRGKPYWKDAPERRDEMVDENGCRTVVKKIVDPEDEKKSSSEKAKSVVITKECEYPDLNGPDAKITEAVPLRSQTSRFDKSDEEFASFEDEPATYEKSRPEELNFKEAADPVAPDYIDTMLEKHFKSFPAFSNPLSSFRGYQERFKLRVPEAFKDVKPTVGVQTYEYSHPKSGFDEERQSSSSAKENAGNEAPKVYEHHYHYDYPENNPRKHESSEYEEEEREKKPSSGKPKEPKMMKKSFAYYRKDNPKTDPNDQQYAEEYAQGNFRSFSSSYDSEKDGPKKKQQSQ